MKNGLPNRNDGANPMPVSAGIADGVADLGRFSRENVRWSSLSLVGVSVLNRFAFSTLIFEGPSIPFAELPYVATSNVWLVFFEWSKLYDAERLLAGVMFQSTLPS